MGLPMDPATIPATVHFDGIEDGVIFASKPDKTVEKFAFIQWRIDVFLAMVDDGFRW